MSPGFTQVDNDAIIARLPEIDGSALKVYLALSRRAGQAGKCWPNQDTIAGDTGLCPRAVRSAVSRLRAMSLIQTQATAGFPTMYYITPAPPCRPENEGAAPPCRIPRHDDAGNPGTAVPVTPAPLCRLIINKKKKQEKYKVKNSGYAAGEVVFPPELDSEVFKVAWDRWKTHRREIGKKLTPSTTFAQLKKLAGWGEARAVAAIGMSIEKGWTGLFEPGGNGKDKFRAGAGQRHESDRHDQEGDF